MSIHTITLETIDSYLGGEPIFPREPKQGIFENCRGTLQAVYQGEIISEADIEQELFEFYQLREMSFETIEVFQKYFSNIWNRNFSTLKQNLLNVQDFTIQNESETYKEEVSSQVVNTGESHNNQGFSNTPNQYLQNEKKAGLTTYTETNGDGINTQRGNGNKTFTSSKQGNAFRDWLDLSEKNRNIIYNFIDKFDIIFLNSISIQNFITRY